MLVKLRLLPLLQKPLWLLVLSLLSLAAQAQQQPDPLAQPVKLSQQNGTVEQLLQELQQQSGISFSYSNTTLPVTRKVSLSGNEKTVKEVLDVLFQNQQVEYLVRGNQVILKKSGRRSSNSKSGRQFTISGYVREAGSGELLLGVSVYVPELQMGTSSNNYGFYSITLPEDSVTILFSFLGYQQQAYAVMLDKNVELNAELTHNNQLKEIEIVGSDYMPVSQTEQMSAIEIPVSQVKEIPALLGEKDVLKVIQLMPGVQKGNEGSSGIYVRGGGPDQNLMILDDATVYNAQHLFGFFSLFNGDALKSIELTKGGFPARYGGRLSSIIEMNMKDGNKEEMHGEAGIGLVSSRLMLEGPIVKEKSSFLFSVRRTYLDMLIQPLLPDETKGGYYFYDMNAKVNYDFGRKDKLFLSGYFGRDKFYFNVAYPDLESRVGVRWGNGTGTLRWNHLFHDQLFSNTSLIVSNYIFNVYNTSKYRGQDFTLDYRSGIRDITLKSDLEYFLHPNHSLRLGISTTHHRFMPSSIISVDTEILHDVRNKHIRYSFDNAVYGEYISSPTDKLKINTGLRISHFTSEKRHYVNPEPRFSASYQLLPDLAAKASFASMSQYVHLLSNTGIGLPTDLWVPATKNVRPQRSHQVAAGFAKDFTQQKFAVTAEGYYKKSNNIIGYRQGANFIAVDDPSTAEDEVDWETNVTSGQGWSYGMELLIQKKTGRLSGWIGYTLSWAQLQFDSLNLGRKFYARYDRRHDISVVGIYEINEKVKVSASWVFGTGNAVTMPLADYVADYNHPNPAAHQDYTYAPFFGTNYVSDIQELNNFRMEPYHRLDLGMQLYKDLGRASRTWEFGIYNAYNRRNPYYYYMGNSSKDPNDVNNKRVLKKVSLFTFIPSVSYNLKF